LKGKYLPGVRNYEWIKLKKSMKKDLVDTIDLVAVGFYNGSGKRSKLGVGAVLGALYNPDTDIYEAICKVGTGFSDDRLKSISKEFQEDILNRKPKDVVVNDLLTPDIWVDPKIVFSVEADEITQNIKADTNIGGGLSLRFPRLVEWGRDKTPEEATTIEELKHLYKVQKMHK
jgi:DNA ligase-1